jgi:hypothetical protein
VKEQLPPWLPRVLVESGFIVFSVLLALVLNEWRAEAAQRARVTQALAAVHAEIEENRRLVTAAMEYHNRVADSFSASAAAGSELPDMSVARRGLLAPASVLRRCNEWFGAGLERSRRRRAPAVRRMAIRFQKTARI